MKKLNKKTPEPTKLQQNIDYLLKYDKSEFTYFDKHEMECKTKCQKLSTDKNEKWLVSILNMYIKNVVF